jgi:uncharacterized protein YegJ (DUF2314 family)
MFWVIVIGLGVLAFVSYRRSQAREARLLVALVVLLKDPITTTTAELARKAARAWGKDIGDGTAGGKDGFLTGNAPLHMFKLQDRFLLFLSRAEAYVDDPVATAQHIPELRMRELFAQHRAWISCDAINLEDNPSEETLRHCYQLQGKLIAEFLNEKALLIFVPKLDRGFAINPNTLAALRSDDPIEGLRRTMTAPMIQIADDDPRMLAAVAEARTKWPEFISAFASQSGTVFSIKAPVSAGGHTEYIWIKVGRIEGDLVHGTLGNAPVNLGALKEGSSVSVPIAALNDWTYVDPAGNLVGGFTVKVLLQAR